MEFGNESAKKAAEILKIKVYGWTIWTENQALTRRAVLFDEAVVAQVHISRTESGPQHDATFTYSYTLRLGDNNIVQNKVFLKSKESHLCMQEIAVYSKIREALFIMDWLLTLRGWSLMESEIRGYAPTVAAHPLEPQTNHLHCEEG